MWKQSNLTKLIQVTGLDNQHNKIKTNIENKNAESKQRQRKFFRIISSIALRQTIKIIQACKVGF